LHPPRQETLTAIKVHGLCLTSLRAQKCQVDPDCVPTGKSTRVNATPHRARYQPHHSARLPLGGFMRSNSDFERDVENEEDALSKLPQFHYA
jgi:hypothetical protein